MSIRVCYLVIYILEACIFWQYCRNLFPSKYSRRREAFALLFCYSLLYIGAFYESIWINFSLFLMINFFYLLLTYNLKYLAAFFHSLFVTMIMVLSEMSILSIISYFAPDFYDERTYFRNLIILAVTSKLPYFLILQCTSMYVKKIQTHELSSDKNTLFLNIFSLFSGFIALVLVAICMNVHLPLYLDITITISALLLLALNIFLAWFHAYIQEKNQEFMELQILLQKESDAATYYKSLNNQDEEQKILIHDIRRHLQSIADLNTQGERKKIVAYIDQIIQSSELQDSVRVCDNDLLNTIIIRFKQQCKKCDTSLITDIRSKCVDFLSEHDITTLFSNLLENAVESAKNIPNSFIELTVTPHINENLTIITMINSCSKNPFSANNQRLISTKQNKWQHGYGIKSIQRIAKKYDGNTQIYYEPQSSTFHTVIVLNKEQTQ